MFLCVFVKCLISEVLLNCELCMSLRSADCAKSVFICSLDQQID